MARCDLNGAQTGGTHRHVSGSQGSSYTGIVAMSAFSGPASNSRPVVVLLHEVTPHLAELAYTAGLRVLKSIEELLTSVRGLAQPLMLHAATPCALRLSPYILQLILFRQPAAQLIRVL